MFKNGFVDGYQWISCVGDWVAILTYGLSCMVLVVTYVCGLRFWLSTG